MPEPQDAPKRCLWLRLDVTLDNDPKIGALAEAMGCDYERALARYARLLIGTRIHAPSGDLTGITDATIGGWMRAPGRKAKEWVAALRDVRIIVNDVLNGWGERQGAIIDKAEKDAKRLLEYRNAQRKGAFATRDESATVAGSVAGSVALSSRVSSSSSSNSSTDETTHYLFADSAANDRPAEKKSKKTDPKPSKQTDAQKIVAAYEDAHTEQTGRKPVITWGAACKLATTALKAMSLDELTGLLPGYFATVEEPSVMHFLAGQRIDRQRASQAAKSSEPDYTPTPPHEVARYKRINQELYAITQGRSYISCPFVLNGRTVLVNGNQEDHWWDWQDPNPGKRRGIMQDYLSRNVWEKAREEKILDADLPAYVRRNVIVQTTATNYGAAS